MSKEIDRNVVFLQGKLVILKVLTEADVHNSNWYGWFNDEATTLSMQKHRFPNTKEDQLEFFRKEIAGNDKKLQLGICTIDGGPIFGVVSLNNIDYISRKAEISMIIGESKYRKIKYMTETLELILSQAFNSLNLRRIYGGTIMNELAELLCRALGFKREGLLRQDVFINGKYHDVYLIGILKEEFEQRQKKEKS